MYKEPVQADMEKFRFLCVGFYCSHSLVSFSFIFCIPVNVSIVFNITFFLFFTFCTNYISLNNFCWQYIFNTIWSVYFVLCRHLQPRLASAICGQWENKTVNLNKPMKMNEWMDVLNEWRDSYVTVDCILLMPFSYFSLTDVFIMLLFSFFWQVH